MKNYRIAMSFCAVVLTPAMAAAAPVTFQFEAEIRSVLETSGADFNLDVSDGDKLTGRFTFEPESLSPLSNPLETQEFMVSQPYSALFEIDGSTFRTPVSTESLRLAAVNNAWVFDLPGASLIDTIKVNGSLVSQDPGAFSYLAASSHFAIKFWGGQLLLDSAGFPSNVMVWNEFAFQRTFLIALVDNSGESLVVSGTIDEMIVVPEPASLTLLLACSLLASMARRQSFC